MSIGLYRWMLLAVCTLTFLSEQCKGDDTATNIQSEPDRQRVFIIGQDLQSVREYIDSDCCPQADAITAYLSFYNLLSEPAGFGGLGIDADGKPLNTESDWGGGPANAWKSATEFKSGLAIGLSLTENDHPGALDRLVAGEYDANIRQLARFFSIIDGPVYLRIGYEFDGIWNQGYENSQRYVAAFKRIVDGLRAEKITHVEYVWQSATSSIDDLIDGGHDNILDWYPGDDYVDWLGISLFLRLDELPVVDTNPSAPSTRQLIGEVLELARQRHKPVMIAEASPQGYDLAAASNANIAPIWDGPQAGNRIHTSPERIWDEWYAPLFELMNENRDVIYSLAYINCHWDSQDMWDAPYESGYWGDSRLQLSTLLSQRFSEAIQQWRSMP